MDLELLRRTEYNQQYIAAMRPVFDRRALFTDTSAEYVIPEEPEPYSEVTIRFRTARNNVDRIFLVSGGQKHLMVRVESDNDFDYYAYVMRLDDQKVSTILKYRPAGSRVFLICEDWCRRSTSIMTLSSFPASILPTGQKVR